LPFGARQTRPFFAGLLPEGQMRRLIAQQFQVLARMILRYWITSVVNAQRR
jgi:serine/threonine-protein kinase HipA